jgi:hypothetical protein
VCHTRLTFAVSPSVRPYACGHERCWPSYSRESQSCFAKSKELSDHNKQAHSGNPGGDRPYRCGLEGCGKSWRVRATKSPIVSYSSNSSQEYQWSSISSSNVFLSSPIVCLRIDILPVHDPIFKMQSHPTSRLASLLQTLTTLGSQRRNFIPVLILTV